MDPSAQPPRAEIAEIDIEPVPGAPPTTATMTIEAPSSTPVVVESTTTPSSSTSPSSPSSTPQESPIPPSESHPQPATATPNLPNGIPILTAPLASTIFRTARDPQAADINVEAINAAHEEEFQKRLRGEYEAAQQRVAEVVWNNMDRPLRLTSIRLSPSPPTTRNHFLTSLLSPFLYSHSNLPSWLYPTPPPPQTFNELLKSTKSIVAYLDQFGIFDMNQSRVRLENKRGGDVDEVELVLGLREKGRLFLKAGTEFGGNEGGGNITARIRNLFGGAETLEVNASLGTKTKSAYQASLTSPLLASPNLSLILAAFTLDRDNTAFASHRESTQGARAKISASTLWGLHELGYEFVQRDITHLAPSASASIRALAEPSTKVAISHTWTQDTRDDPWMATRGHFFKATHEYSGLPGSSERAHFIKSITQSQISRPVAPGSGIHVSIASLTSLLLPLHKKGGTYLPDRTFLGGPNSVRGWKVGGLGLRDGPDSLGGDLAWAIGTSLIAPLPFKPYWPLKLHGFLNLGKVIPYDLNRSFGENVMKMYDRPNLSAGIGLIYRFDPLRVEFNFSMPLVARKGERLSRGFSVGMGIEFL